MDSYHNTNHRTIARARNKGRKNENEFWVRLNGDGHKEHRHKMSEDKKGQMVRISKVKGVFDKGYIPNWSEEHFMVQSDKFSTRRVWKVIDN